MTLSVIFPAYNNWQLTKTCLRSLSKINFDKNQLEIIVVDNASTDDTVLNIKKGFPQIKLIPQKTNLMFAKAVNIAAQKATGKYLFITNNDVTFEKDFFEKLINFAGSDHQMGVVGGKIITYADKKKFPDGPVNISRLTSRLVRLENYNRIQEVGYISGAGMLIKKKIFDEAEGFDENYPFYFEDADLCLKVKVLGLHIRYYPKAVMYHNQSSTAKSLDENWKNKVWYQGKARIIYKHFSYWAKPIALVSQTIFNIYKSFLTQSNSLTPWIDAVKTQSKNSVYRTKKRETITKKEISKYYEVGNVFTARSSAPFQQIALGDFYELLKKNNNLKKWHILEFGAGHGWNLPLMAKYFGRITAVDIAKQAIDESKELGFKNVVLKKVGGEKLPFKSNSFDLIVACEVLEHVADLKITSAELKRITKPGGYILVSVPVYWNLRGISKTVMEKILGEGTWEPAHSHPGGFERLLTPRSIASYFNGFKIIKTRGADYGTAWSLPAIPLYPQQFAPFFEITLGKYPLIKNFGMNYYLLAQKPK